MRRYFSLGDDVVSVMDGPWYAQLGLWVSDALPEGSSVSWWLFKKSYNRIGGERIYRYEDRSYEAQMKRKYGDEWSDSDR